MKRVRTKYGYHDALIVAYQWIEENQLFFRVQLDENGSLSSLRFNAIRNRKTVEAQIDAINQNRSHDRYIAEIVGILKKESHYLVDTGYGLIQLDAVSLQEF